MTTTALRVQFAPFGGTIPDPDLDHAFNHKTAITTDGNVLTLTPGGRLTYSDDLDTHLTGYRYVGTRPHASTRIYVLRFTTSTNPRTIYTVATIEPAGAPPQRGIDSTARFALAPTIPTHRGHAEQHAHAAAQVCADCKTRLIPNTLAPPQSGQWEVCDSCATVRNPSYSEDFPGQVNTYQDAAGRTQWSVTASPEDLHSKPHEAPPRLLITREKPCWGDPWRVWWSNEMNDCGFSSDLEHALQFAIQTARYVRGQ